MELADNERLVREFGALGIESVKNVPDFYTFQKGLVYSHRDFTEFLKALAKKEKCAIVSGLNASGSLHLGHKGVFDTNLFFQKEYGIPVFIPISDDESYVSGKVETQEQALKNSIELAKELIAYGFDPKKTYFIIDQIYTDIYNLAFKLSRKINLSEIKATYGYKNEDNPGLYFYPAVQAAHIIFPQLRGMKNVLVPIGPDEDAHLRICRDVAPYFNYQKPAVLHMKFMPGVDGEKMSKSKNNTILLREPLDSLKKKVYSAFSGGKDTMEEHRRLGGNPDVDVACQYLKSYFLNKEESAKLFADYKSGKLLSGEVKKMLHERLKDFLEDYQSKLKKVKMSDVEKSILTNETRKIK